MTQEQQSNIIQKFVSSFAINEINSDILLNKILNELHEYATPISRQIIRTHYVKWFISHYEMNGSNTQTLIKSLQEYYGEPLGNEPAKYALKSAYVKWFTKNFTMNYANTQIVINHCDEYFQDSIKQDPIKYTIILYFTGAFRAEHHMNPQNLEILNNICLNLFGDNYNNLNKIMYERSEWCYTQSSQDTNNHRDYESNEATSLRLGPIGAGDADSGFWRFYLERNEG